MQAKSGATFGRLHARLAAKVIEAVQVSCKLGNPHKSGPKRIGVIEVIGWSSPPRKMALSANQNHDLWIIVAESIGQMVGVTSETTA
jgi:hypothetical protein